MANKDGINLKVFLQPQIENLGKAKDELGELVKKFGDERIAQSFNKIQNKANGLAQLFSGEFNLTNFKTAGKEIQNIFTEMQKLTLNMGNLDILPGFNELEQKLLKIKQDIAFSEQQRDTTREGGKLDKNGNFKFFKTTVEENYNNKSNKFIRHEKTGHGAQGSEIKRLDGLKKYYEALKELHMEETQDYKDIKAYFDEIDAKEKEITISVKTQNIHITKQKQLQKDIEKQLEEIANMPVDDKNLSDEQKKALQEFNQLYAKLIRLKDEAAEATKNGSQAEKEAGEETKDTSDVLRVQGNELKKQDGVIGKAVKNFTSYTLILGTMKRALRSAIQTITVLDKSLTEQAMVAGRSRKELQGLLKDYQNIAKGTGATTKEIAEVATQYFRQGKSAKDAMILTEAAVSAAKVGAISTSESVDYLTTAINGFGMAAEDATRVSDRFSALAASSATSYEELAVALSKVAAQAHLAEMSMDFTLGLLAKGIETTREAPETIGTALKTIIARMREMTDYGKTLEDGISVNNLEEQLKYVGITLRDNNGELRSSESVLDEVGKSWDSFSKNQQAALAKAFAGTRQQSRFIAMMQDYDRTLELVNISQESSGATMAQMSTYMQGIEAALNNINVGWETLITSFIQSDFIVAFLNEIGNLLNTIGDFFTDQEEGQERIKGAIITAITLLALFSASAINFRLQEKLMAKEQLKIAQEQRITELQKQKEALLLGAIEKRNVSIKKAEAKQEEAILAFKEAQKLAEEGNKVAAEAKRNEAIKLQEESWNIRNAAEDTYQAELKQINASQEMQDIEKQISEEKLAQNKMMQSLTSFMGIYNILVTIGSVIQSGILLTRKLETKELRKQTRELIKQKLLAGGLKAAATGLVAVLGAAALGGAIYGIVKAVQKNNPEYQKKQRRKEIKEDNAEIYKLTQQKTKIEAATTAYDRYNNSVLKTKEQQDEINKQLEAAADILDEEQKKQYDLLKSEKDRANFLKTIQQNKQNELNKKRKNQKKRIDSIEDLSTEIQTDAGTRSAVQDLISSDIKLNNVSAENKAKIKNIIDSQIVNMSSDELSKLYKDKNYSVFNSVAAILDQKVEGTTNSVLDIFNSGTLQEQVKTYNTVLKNTTSETRKIIDTEFGNIAQIAKNFDEETVDIFGKKGFELEEIKKVFEKLQDLMGEDFTLENFSALMKSKDKLKFLQELNPNLDKKAAGGILQDLIYGPKGSEERTAQEVTKFSNEIQNLYENQAKWSTMSAEEQLKFINQHPAFFSNKEAYQKFISGQDISAEMAEYMKDKKEEVLKYLDEIIEAQDIIIATSTNAAEIALAENKKATALTQKTNIETNKIFEENLEKRLKKEQDAIKAFKDILAKQQQAVIDSLNKQKEAYQDYYDTINKAAEDQDYEEKRTQILENISKLTTGIDANSLNMKADLEQQLREAEKERLEELRQRSQEAVLENIDQQIKNAEDELKNINENSQMIIDLMKNTEGMENTLRMGARDILADPNKTILEKQSDLNNLLAQVSPYLLEHNVKLDETAFKISDDGKQLIFNVNGKSETINLDQTTQDDLWAKIEEILKNLGIQ